MSLDQLLETEDATEIVHRVREMKHAEFSCSKVLRNDPTHPCTLFSKLLLLLARLHSKSPNDEDYVHLLKQFSSESDSSRPCVLVHQLIDMRSCTSFRGTPTSFHNLLAISVDEQMISLIHQSSIPPHILESLCYACLDFDLIHYALNFAMQLYILASSSSTRILDNCSHSSVLPTSFRELQMHHSKDLDEVPVGLSPCLWNRLCSLATTATGNDGDWVLPIENGYSPLPFVCSGGDSVELFMDLPADTSDQPVFPNHNDYLTGGMYEVIRRESGDHIQPTLVSDQESYVSTCFTDSTVEYPDDSDDESSTVPITTPSPTLSSILKCNDRSISTLSDGEPPKCIRKRVRFSLSSDHPPPALEDQYGGRSNRKRLLDFARRRQRLSNSEHDEALAFDSGLRYLIRAPFSLLDGPVQRFSTPFRCFLFQFFVFCFSLTLFTVIVCACLLNCSDEVSNPTSLHLPIPFVKLSTLKPICRCVMEHISSLRRLAKS